MHLLVKFGLELGLKLHVAELNLRLRFGQRLEETERNGH